MGISASILAEMNERGYESSTKGQSGFSCWCNTGRGQRKGCQLGSAGATVYLTGRTTPAQRSEYKRPETIEETAELVERAGGQGISMQVDHLDPAQVQALVARIESEQSRLDILVTMCGRGVKLANGTYQYGALLAGGLRNAQGGNRYAYHHQPFALQS